MRPGRVGRGALLSLRAETQDTTVRRPVVAPRTDSAAIVTGGNSGIGRATVVAFAEAGYDVGWTWHSDRPQSPAGPVGPRERAGRGRYVTGASYPVDGGMLLMAAQANREL